MNVHHTPVLFKESIEYLITNRSGNYFEGTLGFGGHTDGILRNLYKGGALVSTDVDENAFYYCKKKFAKKKRLRLYNFNFSLVDVLAKIESIEFFDGIFADLGVSSYQLDNPEAGFSYSTSTSLDLRLDKKLKRTAADIINEYPEAKLAKIINELGEEKKSKMIAKKICDHRKNQRIQLTSELREIIVDTVGARYLTKTLSRVFQAFRIYINDELGVLKEFLENSLTVLKKGGRLVIISYHSLEDRIVKDFFRYENLKCVCPKEVPFCSCGKVQRIKILTRKPVVPLEVEIRNNKRSRSAKLRAAERL